MQYETEVDGVEVVFNVDGVSELIEWKDSNGEGHFWTEHNGHECLKVIPTGEHRKIIFNEEKLIEEFCDKWFKGGIGVIKAEVVFDVDMIEVNGFSIYQHSDEWEINNGSFSDVFSTLEQAISYCLENSK